MPTSPLKTDTAKTALPPKGLANQGLNATPFDEKLANAYRVRIPAYYQGLITHPDDPIAKQCLPHPQELGPWLEDDLPPQQGWDPLAEDSHSPVPFVVHRYPDRALLLVTDRCAMYCRFCMRKRKTQLKSTEGSQGHPYPQGFTDTALQAAVTYLAGQPQVREVILTGGDPLLLAPSKLERILQALAALPHLRHIRVHTRLPVVDPQKVLPEHARVLAHHRLHQGPVAVVTHFNHPQELTPQAFEAVARLKDAGATLLNQAVLLRGVNDDAPTLVTLFRTLMRHQVQPYYLHQADLIPGTGHFAVPVPAAQAIVSQLRHMAPDLAALQYVLDTPGGGGKVPLEAPLFSI